MLKQCAAPLLAIQTYCSLTLLYTELLDTTVICNSALVHVGLQVLVTVSFRTTAFSLVYGKPLVFFILGHVLQKRIMNKTQTHFLNFFVPSTDFC